MDSLRILARNVFYAALAPFKKAYNNYRDDHDQFRQLTHSAGVLEVGAEEIRVHLLPRVSYSPQLRRIIAGVLEQVRVTTRCTAMGFFAPLLRFPMQFGMA